MSKRFATFTWSAVFIVQTLICAWPAVADEPIRLSEPVSQTDTHELFGAPWTANGTALSLSDVVADAERHLDRPVAVQTRIAKVCQKKGCFFVATEGAISARVTFKDYGFFIPTDAGGKTVDLLGTFDRRALSKSQAEHYAKDLGEASPGADAPQYEYVIVASSVRIPK